MFIALLPFCPSSSLVVLLFFLFTFFKFFHSDFCGCCSSNVHQSFHQSFHQSSFIVYPSTRLRDRGCFIAHSISTHGPILPIDKLRPPNLRQHVSCPGHVFCVFYRLCFFRSVPCTRRPHKVTGKRSLERPPLLPLLPTSKPPTSTLVSFLPAIILFFPDTSSQLHFRLRLHFSTTAFTF